MIKKYGFFFKISKILLIFFLILPRTFANALPIQGSWLTFDDKTGLKRSVVSIAETKFGIEGKIIKIYFEKNEGPQDVCKLCSGNKHNQKILGMTILWDVTTVDPHFFKGLILDPKNGKVYHCQLRLSDDAKTLLVRGYIGLPLIGRTQHWERLS